MFITSIIVIMIVILTISITLFVTAGYSYYCCCCYDHLCRYNGVASVLEVGSHQVLGHLPRRVKDEEGEAQAWVRKGLGFVGAWGS